MAPRKGASTRGDALQPQLCSLIFHHASPVIFRGCHTHTLNSAHCPATMLEPRSESSGQTQSIRRSVTLPTKLNPQAQRGSGAPNPGENVIFYHPTAKIVHFAPKALVPIPSSSAPADFDYPVDTIETLPWRSATERTVATAPLRLEKVHGLTVFLKCGNVVHAILKNSQCWCVDGVSKFVLRIRPLTYYRIEIPYETEQDQRLVEDLKAALPTVLRYEVTPCPFKRAFTVEIPEDAMAPRRKRAWKPKRRLDDPITPSGSKGLSSDVKSECHDSGSTGEDTDGAATDDSGFISQRVDSTTSEAVSAGDQSKEASANSFDHPINPHPVRRSVTVTPQSFISLRAKFDESPTRKQAPIREDQAPKTEAQGSAQQSQVSNNTAVADIVADAKEPRSTHDRSVADDSQYQGNTTPEASAPVVTKLPRPATAEETKHADVQSATGEVTDQQAPVPEDITVSNEASEQKAITSEDPVWVESNQVDASAQGHESQEQLLSPQLDSTSRESPAAKEDRPSETVSVSERAAIEMPSVSMEAPGGDLPQSEPDEDHDASFSSTPESFHSADFSPTNSVSIRTVPEESPDMVQQTNPLRELGSEAMAPSKSSEMPSPPKPSASNSHDIPVASPKFAYYETPPDPPKPSLAIPSEPRRSSLPAPKAVSPITDFNHMSTEFRRRSQATRQREVSPMPSPSAIYQPSPGEEATSIISKTLALVLVPPISLLIILLHITARIVISPALGSTSRGSGKGSHASNKEPVTEDDFSFPLEKEASDRKDSEITRKLDPWDLD